MGVTFLGSDRARLGGTLDGKYVRYRALSTYGTATFKGTYRTGTVRYIFFFKFLESTSVNYLQFLISIIIIIFEIEVEKKHRGKFVYRIARNRYYTTTTCNYR